ncbi:hypothetical protein QE152_g22861 [Popillia japonica]|uniref:CCHC-type domain-containing protein n=1 Tax=Popillia japonica TaxID=7064 RepID=A0AAW1KKZ6_POPJA
MIQITGIEKGYSPETFITKLVEQNPEIKTVLGVNVHSKIKYVTRRKCRDNRKENWILQVPPAIFKWFIRNEKLSFDLTKAYNEKLSFDLTKAYVQEYVTVSMCFNCCNFGHVAKHCNNGVCCHKCGENHDSRECPESQNLNCPNCKKLRLPERKHSARDPKRSAYLKNLNKQKQYINYTDNTTDHFLLKG